MNKYVNMQLDYLIIGAGPAGLQMGYYFDKSNKSYLIVEKGSQVGEFFKTFPRHRQLISINKKNTGFEDEEMNLRWDWNSLLNDKVKFTDYTDKFFPDADVLCNYLADFKKIHELKVKQNFDVATIRKNTSGFEVKSQDGEVLSAKRVIVATGYNAEKLPEFPGSELVEPYSKFNIDADKYTNKRILILGKGNSSFETADSLIENAASIHISSPNSVKLAWETHYVGHLRAVNNNFLDTYQLKSQNVILDADIDLITKEGDQFRVDITYTHAMEEKRTIYYDHVISAIGFKLDTSIFDESCKPDLCPNNKFPALNKDWCSSNVPDLYFAGTLMHSLDYKKTMSGFIHGFRYNIKALAEILDEKHHGITSSIGYEIDLSLEALSKHICKRVTETSSMFLQPGFFGDVLVQSETGEMSYVNDVPVDYFCEEKKKNSFKGRFYIITLEYGDWSNVKNPFRIDRDPSPKQAHLAEYIHPMIREYVNDEVVDTFHVPEDLENIYTQDIFHQLIEEYLVSKF
jgi:thioredoxin reductase